MAGKLPGIECARRRRFPGSSGWYDSSVIINSAFGSTRSWRFYDTHCSSSSFSPQRSMVNQTEQDEMLGCVARKAKERLDGRLRSYWKSEINSQERSNGTSLVEETRRKPRTSVATGDLQQGAFGLKKSGSKMFNWGKAGLNRKSSDQEECVVCLEKFKVGEKLDRLPCAHRFHSMCLLPWLEDHAHCPCCRMSVLGST
ncbi:putative transcription factor C2H2 family [Helianthus annuus]|uniref:Transcription factor C2H2 family n=1 Tax=Helianthus annuus TaxID=4232 RepID=A0A9K3HEI8_HELAN|nr:probable E3 ubiquitin-protein ligase RHY1A isoform X2 [Helianthus annuus]KAF5776473.1 putative transcription factor C2H2 family [Helianthus annuus]KAJ0491568.1 putative transcription factor C2H2 family [Helianthus annuus]KAJ0865027.1 putative transcription factor C2H2 family [Helianthus annuus]